MAEIRCHLSPWSNQVDLLIFDRSIDGAAAVAEPLVMRTVRGLEHVSPTLSIDKQAAQSLMDQLWNCGLRPSEGSGSAGALAATERHLTDMRSIATGLLKNLNIPLP